MDAIGDLLRTSVSVLPRTDPFTSLVLPTTGEEGSPPSS
uniref:Spermatocyte-specific marker protein n=1 Tax=Mus musculus TaxID=10090 RepID=Q2V9F5_MOUSE|nr:spermatocyte-specific marker protein [Mus musculus]